MKTAVVLIPLLAGVALPAMAYEENARVISSVPIVEQVAIPQQMCSQQPVVTSSSSGTGAVIGGIAGGVLGNTIGHGGGRAAATMLGVVGGAMVGDRVERTPQVQNVQNCTTQTIYEERTTGYTVTYDYAGRQYTTRMANDPGRYVRIDVAPVAATQVSPVMSSQVSPVMSSQVAPVVSSSQPVSVQPGVVVSSAPAPLYAPVTTTYYPAPTYVAQPVVVAPYPVYSTPYYGYAPPVSLNLGIGYYHGWRR